MRTRATTRVAVLYTWDRMRVSFWFAPAIMTLGAILLAWAMYWIDDRIPNEMLKNNRLILTGSVVELRSYLFTMATTVLATAGIVFTLLTLPLSTVASQYGSRLLRVFLGDHITQLVLGMFAATFVYCLASALSIPPVEVKPEGPQLTDTLGLFLMLGTFASLILLVQHISTMLQAPNIASAAGAELRDVVLAEIPDQVSSGDEDRGRYKTISDSLVETDAYPVRAKKTGYIQYIDPEAILLLSRERNLILRLLHKPGDFVRRGMVVVLVWPAARVNPELDRLILNTLRIGNTRLPTQDVEYAINQLVEMAVRAMSPAINDPFTALTCLDYIGEGLALFIRQGERSPYYYDAEGQLCLIFEPITFKELLSAAFDMLRQASCDNTRILLHMLDVIDVIGQETKAPEVRRILASHTNLIQAESQVGRLIEADRQLIQRRSKALLEKFSGAGERTSL